MTEFDEGVPRVLLRPLEQVPSDWRYLPWGQSLLPLQLSAASREVEESRRLLPVRRLVGDGSRYP